MIDLYSILVTLTICVPAVLMAIRQSSYLVDYMFIVISLNRGVRRIVDYQNGYFNPYSLISLTPIIVSGLATLVILIELNNRKDRFGGRTGRVLSLYGFAVTVAFLIGFANAKFGAVYALGDYIAPIGLIGYGSLFATDESTINRWTNVFAFTALVVAIYGIWQFYTIPPWDGFWLKEAKQVGYMGLPVPQKMTLFSTMAERGPAAMYLCNGLILLLLRPATLYFLRFPAIVLVGFAMLLTYSRTTVIFALLASVLYPLLNRGSGLLFVLVIAVIITVFGPSVMPMLPGQSAARVETVGHIYDDSSLNGRLKLLGLAISASYSEPLGLGIGSHGMASRVQEASRAGVGDASGYLETLRTYGWIGFAIIVSVLFRIWDASRYLMLMNQDDENVRLFRAWFISGMAILFSGNWLAGASFFWVLAGNCLGLADQANEDISDLGLANDVDFDENVA